MVSSRGVCAKFRVERTISEGCMLLAGRMEELLLPLTRTRGGPPSNKITRLTLCGGLWAASDISRLAEAGADGRVLAVPLAPKAIELAASG